MNIKSKYKVISSAVVLILFLLAGYLFLVKIAKRHIILGAWTEGLINPKTSQLNPEKLKQFEVLVDKKMSIAHYYLGWEHLDNKMILNQFETLNSYDWTPMVNVNPYFFKECPVTDNVPLYKAIAEGKCDAFLKRSGKNLSKAKSKFYFLFAWEMNNNINQWSIPYSGSTSEDFIAAWRRIHGIFKKEGVKKIVWVFCPNVPDDSQYPYHKIYPGKDYVDWIGMDGYNWGTTQSWSQWVSFSGVFTKSYTLLSEIAPDKPMMLAEVNTTDSGGDKGKWYKDMFEKEIPANFPKIKAVVIFNEDRSKTEHVNWLVNVTPSSLNAFKEGINSGYY